MGVHERIELTSPTRPRERLRETVASKEWCGKSCVLPSLASCLTTHHHHHHYTVPPPSPPSLRPPSVRPSSHAPAKHLTPPRITSHDPFLAFLSSTLLYYCLLSSSFVPFQSLLLPIISYAFLVPLSTLFMPFLLY